MQVTVMLVIGTDSSKLLPSSDSIPLNNAYTKIQLYKALRTSVSWYSSERWTLAQTA